MIGQSKKYYKQNKCKLVFVCLYNWAYCRIITSYFHWFLRCYGLYDHKKL